ncbi:MAG: hypothetical protein QW177_00325 [Candidatus Nitrosotenuis sp.]
MQKQHGQKNIMIVIGASLMASGFASYVVSENLSNDGHFAQCLSDRGLTLYGASWCPHCQQQREMFGASQKYLNYVECSSPDGKSQTATCQIKNINTYPTWELPDGTRLIGTQSLTKLSEVSGCSLSGS